MKNILTTIFLFSIFTSNTVDAQSKDPILQKLIDNNLIEQKQVKDFEKSRDRVKTKNTTSYLYGLFQCEYKSITGNFFSEIGSHDIFESEKLNEDQQKKENQELIDYLLRLKKCELLNEKQTQYFHQKINKKSYTNKLQFISDITFKAFKEDYMAPDKLKEFADKLKQNGIVEMQDQNLIFAIDNQKIKNPIDMLAYCSKAVIIDPKNYASEPEKYLELVHQKTATILPELAFTNFEFQIALDSIMSDEDDKFYDFIVSIQSNGIKYKQKSFYHMYTPSKNKYSSGFIDSQEYYKIFNKILADQHSPYRLHRITSYNEDTTEEKPFGIMALSKDQEKAFQNPESYLVPSSEDFKNKPTTSQIEKAIEDYIKIGLFSNLTVEQINLGKEKVSQQENSNYNQILFAFPNMIYWFDTELGNLEDPYAELIKEFAIISHNEFNPSHVSNSFDIEKSKKTTLKFKLDNKSYTKVFKIDNDWIDPDFFDFVKSVVTEQKLKGQFYELYTGGQDAQVVFLTKEQYDYIRVNKLLLFANQEWKEE
ncbi:hypothetical protein [Flavobacterium foetidum]|uniref:hypothetical protein n=1 Tax=Flavobacterium foetidum TaxID=2026681 RepID=UPI00107521C9|nr:hypothetical protein [Flavobacterium foetidum]KAF2506589.1 hypothetical protein E0W73_21085 [Flavobacterium foetidum]